MFNINFQETIIVCVVFLCFLVYFSVRFRFKVLQILLLLSGFLGVVMLRWSQNAILLSIFLISLFILFVFLSCEVCYKEYKKLNKENLIRTEFDPIVSSEYDKIGREKEVNVIVNFIKENQKGYILITGVWGSGKTSLINLVKEKLINGKFTDKKYKFLCFDIWEYADFNSILKAIIRDIAKVVNFLFPWLVFREFKMKLYSAEINSLDLDIIFDNFNSFEKMDFLKKYIAKCLERKKEYLVLVFDDIERSQNKEILINFFKIIAYFLNIPRVFIISAVDEENLKNSIPNYKGYLNKIANLVVYLHSRNFSRVLISRVVLII